MIDRNHLELCKMGEKTYWQSNEWGNFDGLFVKLDEHGHIQIKCSLHKVWRKHREDGKLDNSRPFCITHAIASIGLLEDMTGVDLNKATVAYFELGLNLPMSQEASEYIAEVDGVDCEKGGKALFVDANFDADRQKTSLKTKNMRKVLKMYDKSYEALDRGREDVEPNILRIETMYKRQKVPMDDFVSRAWLDKYAKRFYADWQKLKFRRELRADPGCKASQIEKAREIRRIGLDAYLNVSKQAFSARRITKKQWETIRTFARAWPTIEGKYNEETTPYEDEYRQRLEENFNICYL